MRYLDGFFTVQGVYPDDTYDAAALRGLYGPVPDLQTLRATRKVNLVRELLRAWDPVSQKIVWEHETSSGIRGYDGGAMSTAGNLVFQGRGSGELWVYAADSGKVLKVIKTGSHIMAAPMTYAIGGEQFVAVQAGYGGSAITVGPIPPSSAAAQVSKHQPHSRFQAGRRRGAPAAGARRGAFCETAGGDCVQGGHRRRRNQVHRRVLTLPCTGAEQHT